MKFETRLLNFEAAPGDRCKPVATPIYQTATFRQEGAVEFGDYDYSRSGNPTRAVLESQIADLEGGQRAFCFASGMAAITAVTRLLHPGDEIVACDDLYGGTFRLFSRILKSRGIETRYLNFDQDIESAIPLRTRLVYLETPTNPLLKIVDIRSAADLAHRHGALLCVDNSTMSPYLQNPLALGADIVVHSATKFLCGHSDVTAGAVVLNDPKLAEDLYLIQNGEGAGLGPFDSFLLLRGLKTLALRIDRQQQNALRIAKFLSQHAKVSRVHYPGLSDHPGRECHRAQARGAGSVVSFETGSFALSQQIAEATRIFNITVSFGSVNSSISLPVCMSHASIPPEVRARKFLPQDLVRLSVGIENVDDLIGDLDQALARTTPLIEEEPIAAD